MRETSLPFHEKSVSNISNSRFKVSVPSTLSSMTTGLLYSSSTVSSSGQDTDGSNTPVTAQLLNFSGVVWFGTYSSNSFRTLIRQICSFPNRPQPSSLFRSSSVTGHSSRPSRILFSPVAQNTIPKDMAVISQKSPLLLYPPPMQLRIRATTSCSSGAYFS